MTIITNNNNYNDKDEKITSKINITTIILIIIKNPDTKAEPRGPV